MRTFTFQGMVQFDSDDEKLTICGDQVKWLEVVSFKGLLCRQAESKAFKYFDTKYPEYKGFVQLT